MESGYCFRILQNELEYGLEGDFKMPFVEVKTTVALDKAQTNKLRDEIRTAITLIPQKTADNMMLQIESGCDMWMGDLEKPCAFVDIRLYGPSPLENKKVFVEAVLAALEPYGIEASRVYMNIWQRESWVAGNHMLG